MITIEQIEKAIANAKDPLTTRNLFPISNIRILSGNGIRKLLNEIASHSEYYLEAGVFCGGTFCAAIYNNDNLKGVCAIDHWNENANYANGKNSFNQHVPQYKPKNVPLTLIEKNHWDVSELPFKPDFYFYDGAHDEASQEKALTHFGKMCTDTFCFVVDDWNNKEVQAGTRKGLEHFEILFEHLIPTQYNARSLTSPHISPFWNGFGVWILKQKKGENK